MAASARTSGTSAPDSSSLKRGSWASRNARAAADARAVRRWRAAVAEYFEAAAGVFFRVSFFVLVPDDRVWPARVSDGRPRTTRLARRHRAQGKGVGRFGITGATRWMTVGYKEVSAF